MKFKKYRVWDSVRKCIYTDIGVIDFNKEEIYVNGVGYIPFSELQREKNSEFRAEDLRHIYENDIVQFYSDEDVDDIEAEPDEKVGYVFYDDGNFYIIQDDEYLDLKDYNCDCKIIGNVHENSELLKTHKSN